MSWIKRNLSLVISGVIALGLLGFGGYYLFSAIKKNEEIDQQIGQTKSEIERLLGQDPTPNQDNLKLARQEAAKLASFVAEAKKQFPPTPPPAEPLNDLSFRSLLETTVNDLHKQAASVGITVVDTNINAKINERYYFTFESHRETMRFPPESLLPLSERLHEVRHMAEILFKARVNRLAWIKRAAVPGERQQPGNPGGGGSATADYLNAFPRTNAETAMVLWPYEVAFDCFSPELGAVLEAFERTPGFIVKALTTDVAPELTAQAERRKFQREFVAPQPPAQPPQRIPGRVVPNVVVRTNVPALTTVIDERPVRVTLRIEVIKPQLSQPGGGGPGGGRPQRGGRPPAPGNQP